MFASGLAWITNAWTEGYHGPGHPVGEHGATGVRTVWNNVSSWIARQLLQLVGAIQSALQTIAQYDPTGLAQKLSDSLSLDVEGAADARRGPAAIQRRYCCCP